MINSPPRIERESADTARKARARTTGSSCADREKSTSFAVMVMTRAPKNFLASSEDGAAAGLALPPARGAPLLPLLLLPLLPPPPQLLQLLPVAAAAGRALPALPAREEAVQERRHEEGRRERHQHPDEALLAQALRDVPPHELRQRRRRALPVRRRHPLAREQRSVSLPRSLTHSLAHSLARCC